MEENYSKTFINMSTHNETEAFTQCVNVTNVRTTSTKIGSLNKYG